VALVEELERLLGRRVDLVAARSLSRHFRPYIEAEAQPL
jgi:predicted nucleotidyltransferase